MRQVPTNSKDKTVEQAEKLRSSGELEQALAAYRLYLDRCPSDVDARSKLAEVLAQLGNKDSAISNYIKVQEKLAAAGDIVGAIAAGLKVIEIDPGFENPLSRLARNQAERLQSTQEQNAVTQPFTPSKPLPEIPLLCDLNPSELQAVAWKMRAHEKQVGNVIFEEGDEGDSVFFVHRGAVEVSSGGRTLSWLGSGECFGEFSFLTHQPRTATVRAVEVTELLELSAADMDAVARSHPRLRELLHEMYRERALANVLASSPLFEMLDPEDRNRVATQVELVTVEKGWTVVRRGETGGAIFLVKSGKLEVRAEAPNGEEIILATLGPHQFFGEVSFLTGVPRTATVVSLEDCELLRVGEADLRRLLSDYPKLTAVLKKYHLDRVTATAEALKAFLKKGGVDGVLG